MIRIPYVAALYERILEGRGHRPRLHRGFAPVGKKIRDFLLTGRVVCGYCSGRSMA